MEQHGLFQLTTSLTITLPIFPSIPTWAPMPTTVLVTITGVPATAPIAASPSTSLSSELFSLLASTSTPSATPAVAPLNAASSVALQASSQSMHSLTSTSSPSKSSVSITEPSLAREWQAAQAPSSAASIPDSASESQPPSGPVLIAQQPKKGPFTPAVAFIGGIPTEKIDLPISIVFLVLFAAGAATHISIFNMNKKRGHKFLLSDLVFDFCMVRVVTMTMRIVWVFRTKNNSVVLAAIIFQNAGTIVLFAVNIIFTQRIIRAIHPNFGWNSTVTAVFIGLLILVPVILIYNIAFAIAGFFLLDRKILELVHNLQILGNAVLLLLAIFPIPILLVATIIPSSTPVQKFGIGRFRWKIVILIIASMLLTVGAIVRLIGLVTVAPANNPASIDGKVLFYITGFALEVIVVAFYAIVRVDLIFYVPDGSKKAGDYSRNNSPIPPESESVRNLVIDSPNLQNSPENSFNNSTTNPKAPTKVSWSVWEVLE